MPRHVHVSFASSEGSTSIDASLRPCLRHVYPLPEDQGGSRFQHLLDSLAQRSERTRQDP
jgi:hypothetical protein